MNNSIIKFRIDESIKKDAIILCHKLGINLSTYLRMCMSRLVQEKGVPFSMKLEESIENHGIVAMKKASAIAEERGIADISLDEINLEIKEARTNN